MPAEYLLNLNCVHKESLRCRHLMVLAKRLLMLKDLLFLRTHERKECGRKGESAIYVSDFLFFSLLFIMVNYCVKPGTVTLATKAGAVV